MEYFLKEITEKLLLQRSTLVNELASLNENLPNYTGKVLELNNQISLIDGNVREFIFQVRDMKQIELQNELTIKTSK